MSSYKVAAAPDSYEFKQQYFGADDEWINTGDSVIVAPDGEILAGPARKVEKVLYAEIEPKAAQGNRWKLDVAGHYSRPDVFELIVHTDERPTFVDLVDLRCGGRGRSVRGRRSGCRGLLGDGGVGPPDLGPERAELPRHPPTERAPVC